MLYIKTYDGIEVSVMNDIEDSNIKFFKWFSEDASNLILSVKADELMTILNNYCRQKQIEMMLRKNK